MHTLEMNKKIRFLQEIREEIGDYNFRRCVARVYTQHYIEVLESNELKISREDFVFRVNCMLEEHNVKPMSYYFFRQFNMDGVLK
ncbi:hypothetical protein RGU76_08055 [Bacillus pseudomycoides]|uniref:hypothetical protein n=1 Tax=Bacillus TaxID=1386 RepID=UPI0022494BF4|nr:MULTISPECIES: hypothetical protein [Bacillus]MCX2828363.1 hypothetical protein [Bacillus sp. DHT2]MDR4915049.1 hypothetical protein [Bacillus pseudomycoides]